MMLVLWKSYVQSLLNIWNTDEALAETIWAGGLKAVFEHQIEHATGMSCVQDK